MKLKREDIEIRVIPILKKYDVQKAALFGSYARGDETEDSDVDILVELNEEDSDRFIIRSFDEWNPLCVRRIPDQECSIPDFR